MATPYTYNSPWLNLGKNTKNINPIYSRINPTASNAAYNVSRTNPYSAVNNGLTLSDVNKLVKQGIEDSIRKGQINESIALMNQLLEANDLGGIAGRVADMFYQGKSYNEVYLSITKTPEYNDRFPGLNQLRQKGLAITEGAYNEQMNSYSKIFKSAGLDSYADFKSNKNTYANFLINDISPEELKARVNTATSFVNSADSTITDTFQKYYGVSKKDLVAYYLDPDLALNNLQRKTEAAQLGTVAANVGMDLGVNYAESLSARAENASVTGQNIANTASAISSAGAVKEEVSKLAGISGGTITGKELIESRLGDINAQKKVQGLASQERARFSGKSAGTGIIGQNVSGSY